MNTSRGAGRVVIFVIILVAIGVSVLAWFATRPGPLAFAAGKAVALDAYAGHPTGVPTDFSATDAIARGRITVPQCTLQKLLGNHGRAARRVAHGKT